ncbi:MAG: oxygenase MpaB family protein [Polyangiales bacterium]|nr:DUF2236 domain-containing protein [Myxococcales bacterium]
MNSARIPTEFRYWEQLDSPYAKALRRLLQGVLGVDPRLPREAVQKYAEAYFDADPVAEAFVDEVYMTRGQQAGRAMVDQALAHGLDSVTDAPESLKRLFAEIEQVPSWLDWEQVELGARVFRRFSTYLYSFAGVITLHGYRENSVAKPLSFTGAYNGESANRRFLETAAFWIDVAEPGGLRPGGKGRETALRVRLMHVFVRRRLLAHPGWDLEAWGVPISQGDALLTLMGGSVAPGYGLRFLGFRVPREEIVALLHFWRYVGHLVGVQPRWYPSTPEEGIGLLYASEIKGVRGSGDDGRQLALSYLESFRPTDTDSKRDALIKSLEHGLERGYAAWFLPPQSRFAYKLPGPGLWALHPPAQFLPRFAFETVRRRVPRVDAWADARARRKTKAWVRARLGERKVEYQAVSRFTR